MAEDGVSGISGADEDEGPNAECRVRADEDEGAALRQGQILKEKMRTPEHESNRNWL